MKNILQTFFVFFYKKEVSYGCMYLIKNTVTLSNIRTILMNCFLFESILNAVYFCDQSWIFRIITVFSVTWFFRNHSEFVAQETFIIINVETIVQLNIFE